jgi:hypothetical protein
MQSRERMMRGVPAGLFLIPFEHGEIGYPEECEGARIEQAMALRVLLRHMQT